VRGIGTASGAITLVNALPTGIGCAVAISLPVRAEIELRPVEGTAAHRLRIERDSDSELVRETLSRALTRFAPGQFFSGELKVESRVPPQKGLKSSSAVTGAVLQAISNALRRPQAVDGLARFAADIAQEIGLSATGAYDDCLAAVRGGLAFTDNATRTSLRAAPFDFDRRVALWIPPGTHAPSTGFRDRARSRAAEGRAAVEAARAGRWAEAMALNSALVEGLMEYDYREVRAEVLRLGATACGVSGMGPALAALVPRAALGAVVAHFASGSGQVLEVGLRPEEGSAGALR
jgi:shikimate kinase